MAVFLFRNENPWVTWAGSVQGALASGARAAREVLADA